MRQDEGQLAYPSTRFLLARETRKEETNDPRRQHTRSAASDLAGGGTEWQRECDLPAVRAVPHGVLSPAAALRPVRPGDLLSLDTFYVGKLKGVGDHRPANLLSSFFCFLTTFAAAFFACAFVA